MIPGGPGLYAELMRRRMGPQAPEPQGPVMPALPPNPQDYLTQLLAQSQVPVKPPSLMDRIRSGVQVPNTPIVRRKGRVGRLFLRGLVGGFKNSGDQQYDAAGKPVSARGGGGGAMSEYQRESLRLRAQAEERQGKLMESLVGHRSTADEIAAAIAPLQRQNLEGQIQDRPADNARMAAEAEERARHNRAMEAVARQNAAVAMGNLQERRKAAGLQGEAQTKWPQRWKNAYAASLRAFAAQDAEARSEDDYDPSTFQIQVQDLNEHYLNMEVQATGQVPSTYFQESPAQSGRSTTAGGRSTPAPKATGAPPKRRASDDPAGIR